MMDEYPDICYDGNSPTSPWNFILKRVLDLRTENPRTVSGTEYPMSSRLSPGVCSS
jgi:hypothetical protein